MKGTPLSSIYRRGSLVVQARLGLRWAVAPSIGRGGIRSRRRHHHGPAPPWICFPSRYVGRSLLLPHPLRCMRAAGTHACPGTQPPYSHDACDCTRAGALRAPVCPFLPNAKQTSFLVHTPFTCGRIRDLGALSRSFARRTSACARSLSASGPSSLRRLDWRLISVQ